MLCMVGFRVGYSVESSNEDCVVSREWSGSPLDWVVSCHSVSCLLLTSAFG